MSDILGFVEQYKLYFLGSVGTICRNMLAHWRHLCFFMVSLVSVSLVTGSSIVPFAWLVMVLTVAGILFSVSSKVTAWYMLAYRQAGARITGYKVTRAPHSN